MRTPLSEPHHLQNTLTEPRYCQLPLSRRLAEFKVADAHAVPDGALPDARLGQPSSHHHPEQTGELLLPLGPFCPFLIGVATPPPAISLQRCPRLLVFTPAFAASLTPSRPAAPLAQTSSLHRIHALHTPVPTTASTSRVSHLNLCPCLERHWRFHLLIILIRARLIRRAVFMRWRNRAPPQPRGKFGASTIPVS
ncbi:hypothetical protein EJ02DRAFT_456638 [Clathrospora elynae]|uniref:Uncharacterized protein n=1 Tax=Clathrospora elynae TaxID=706981 RepID=A0A6A5SK02_9PLEO|nr:hypothetical protein EJ02DRAFT_456638 [Clathrospora elynae]